MNSFKGPEEDLLGSLNTFQRFSLGQNQLDSTRVELYHFVANGRYVMP